ncbi:N-acetyltransferase [Bacillus sp. FJAT-22090]|uniref:GNAT family N-acetyltransferase n=1 Tax=Bacillus sp. FJAT-22090 TaxID=1581038 RepID=UPI0011A52FD3|nr:GNAT family N-acetyltransferase [Bacillus sp. FJAT-22090]
MIKLEKMKNNEFKKYLDFMVPDYAKDISNNYDLPMDKAMEESELMMKDLLPDGLSTKNQFLLNIYDHALNKKVGLLWFNVNKDINRAFLYHIYIEEAYRQNGYATKALEELQVRVKELGMNSIALSVFGGNENALRLYKKMGYSSSSISMHKLL